MDGLDGPGLGPLFTTAPHAASPWFVGFLLLLALPGALIVLWGLVAGQLPRVAAGLGLFAVPVFVFLLANGYLLEASKDTRFCGSCHVMQPIVEGALAGGEELAGRHIALGAIPRTQACYTCHSNYGVWGTVQAKSAGLMHIVRNALGWYHFPLQHNGPYPVSICLSCHAQSVGFRSQPTHTDLGTQQALLDGSLSCAGTCHPAPHPEGALWGPGGKPR